MSTTAAGSDWSGGPRRHAVPHAVAAMHAELDRVQESVLWSVPPDELSRTLTQLTRLAARVSELELRVAVAADRSDVRAESGSTSSAAWWASATRQTKAAAYRRLRLATSLDWHHEPVRDALAAGDVVVEQAETIVRSVDALRTGPAADLVDPETVVEAERRLLILARDHDAKDLAVLGRRILDVVAPEVAEAHEARLLEKQERDAVAATRFTMSEGADGQARGRFSIPAETAQMLRKQLMALLNPAGKTTPDGVRAAGATATADADGRPLSGPQRLGLAFVEYVRRYPTDAIPTAGGVAADVTVTIAYDRLVSGLGSAQLDTGGVISAAQARLLACEAKILPMVLNGRSEVLDCGRAKRLAPKAHRAVLTVTQGGCTAEGCDWPPGMCHVHHDIAWAAGGPTSVANARLLCPSHHARVHDRAYAVTRLPSNKIRFTRRT